MNSGIYMWTSPSGKSYIGQAKNLQERKWEFNSKSKRYSGLLINRAREKYSKDEWEYKILEYCEPNELNEKEKFWIGFYDTYNNGYNLTLGGDTSIGYSMSTETKEKISKSKKGGIPWNKGKEWDNNFKTKNMLNQKQRKIIIQLNEKQEFIKEWDSLRQIERELGYYHSYIGNACKQNSKAYNYYWKYKNKE